MTIKTSTILKTTLLRSKDLIATFFAGDFGKLLLFTLLWQLGMTLLGLIIEYVVPVIPHGILPMRHFGIFDHTMRWDALWFYQIPQGYYAHNPYSPAFYPLFPFLTYVVHTVSFGALGYITSGILVNTIASWLTFVALFKICRILWGRHHAFNWLVLLLFVTSPAALFLHMYYSEAVFCAFAFWAYYFSLRRNWLACSILLAGLTASRVTAILFIGLCFLEFCRAYDWQPKKILVKQVLWFLITPLGFVIYGLYLHHVRGDFFSMAHSYKLWSFHVFNPNFIGTFINAARTAFNGMFGVTPYSPAEVFVNFTLPVVALSVLLATSLIALIRIRSWAIPLGIFGLLSFVMFTLNSDVNSVHRYVLPCISVFLIVGYSVMKRPKALIPTIMLCTGSFGLQVILYMLFVNGHFAG
jgi:hypothetical protein